MIKRCFDIIASVIGVVLLSPLFLGIAIWIKLDSDGPILFIQQRVGLNGQSIGVLKFRTMVVNAESKGLKVTVGKDPRITASGSLLRKYKLDELAQLFNVILGSMSLVGPRPEVKEYIDVYSEETRQKVLSVKPGITDLASIEFKDESSILEGAQDPNKTYIEEILPIKQKYYVDYVNDHSLIGDISIILKTLTSIMK